MNNKKGSSKKVFVICGVVVLSVALIAAAVVLLAVHKKKQDELARIEAERKAEEARLQRLEDTENLLVDYYEWINIDNYSQMYNSLDTESKGLYTLEAFTKANQGFYDDIKATDIVATDIVCTEVDEQNMDVAYAVSLKTTAGMVDFNNTVSMVCEEEEWKIKWTEATIYPTLQSGYHASIKATEPKRGSIYDKNDTLLAGITSGTRRSYPLAESAAHIVGFVNKVTAAEMEERVGYQATSLIGKKGLEYSFEEKLRGSTGIKLAILDAGGNEVETIIEEAAVDGEDLKTTIDADIQKAIYNQIKGDTGCSVAINPYTGEILAMVSTPSYNSNGLYDGTASDTYNRFARTFCPGSTFKSITGAIGLETGSFAADEDFGPSSTKWQKDSSWGNLYITTLHACTEGTLYNALPLSDNVYFAKAALKIGSSKLASSLDKIGFNEQIPFEMNFSASQYSNTKSFSSEGMLANSGYGQGEILVNPLHMASIYASFVNGGDMVLPCFEYSGTTKYWKEDAFSASTASTIKGCLIDVVKRSDGTAHSIYSSSFAIGGKTGTAEIKASQSDTNGTELGWFVAFTADETENPILIVTMIEDVKDRGGSGYVVKKTKAIFDAIY